MNQVATSNGQVESENQGPCSPRFGAFRFEQRGRQNIRYASLLPQLPAVRTYGLVLPRGRIIQHGFNWLNRRILEPYVYRRLMGWISRRHPYFLAVEPGHLPYLKCPVIVDDDDPEFSSEHVGLLNAAHVRAVVTTSDILRERLLKLGLKKDCLVIPSGVHLKTLQPQGVEAVRQRLGKQPGDVVVGFAMPTLYFKEREGLPDHEPGMYSILLLTQIMERVWKEDPRIQLWLMGRAAPPVVEYTRQHPQVRLLGYVPHQEVLLYYANFDITVYPRIQDVGGRHSIKLVEFMACGCPIVSTAVTESYLAVEAGAGLIADDAGTFAQYVLDLAHDDQKRAELGARGRAFAANYDWPILARRYEQEVLDVYAPA